MSVREVPVPEELCVDVNEITTGIGKPFCYSHGHQEQTESLPSLNNERMVDR